MSRVLVAMVVSWIGAIGCLLSVFFIQDRIVLTGIALIAACGLLFAGATIAASNEDQ